MRKAGKVRMMAVSVPVFRHAGLEFGAGWNTYDVAGMNAAARACVRAYLGRFIRVHPDDARALDALLADASAEADVETDTDDAAADTELEGMTVTELRELAVEHGVEIPPNVRKKADILAILDRATTSTPG